MSPEEETVVNRNMMKLQDHLYKALKQRDQYKAENEKLKEEVEHLNSVIQDEEDWKTIEQEYEEWSDGE
ncbi:hypothetical protein AST00_10725 [Staphylococcus equorum]|uniref:hypothetical protein n=1 Tax=Staphylococcus equorum TaxID=246432 RepID=UPI000853D891|nr:hypothetical protein [Staphylococcus equorum]OEK64377.1 hypothetical protein AST00_10725 [Staphylococcus equorum]